MRKYKIKFNIEKKIIMIAIITIITYIMLALNTYKVEANAKTMKIVIDPGHGGYDPGAINENSGIIEKDITLKTSRYLREYLSEYYGVEIVMTHDGLSNSEDLAIVDRGMKARTEQADLMLSIHFNASASEGENGAEVYVTNNESCHKYKQESTEIGNEILNNLSKLGIRNRGVKTRLCNDIGPKWEYIDGSKADYYGVIRYAMKGDAEDRGLDITKGVGITTILIENCFIKGNDEKYINSDEKLKKIAEADGKAIADHYGLILKKDVVNVDDYAVGDVNMDGKVNLIDYTKILAHVKKTSLLTGKSLSIADVNKDGKVNLIDYTKVLAHVKKTALLS